jgi:hypothetical protein
MNQRSMDRLMRRLAATELEEISCSECFELLSSGVELELAGATCGPVRASLSQHLRQCDVCCEEYEVLRDFVRSETG